MNNRERVLSVLDQRPPDRVPWIPRLLLWYQARILNGNMPEKWRGRSLREIERDLGVGTPARDARIFEQQHTGVEILTRDESGKRITEYRTPVGAVRSVERSSEDLDRMGLPGRVEEHLLKSPQDIRVWEYVVEHTTWVATYDSYRRYDEEIGGDGFPMVTVGDVPFHEFAQQLAGYEHAYYLLADHRREVEHLLARMMEIQQDRMWPIVLDSPARLFLHGLHLSSQFTPPPIFESYVLPYYERFFPRLHDRGKAVAMHADNDTSQILGLIERAGWDMVECFVTAPMVPLTLDQARRIWGERVIIWGGIPSLMLSPSVPEEEFRSYCHRLFDSIAPGRAFILGVADNVMPDSLIERVAWISDLVVERGVLPIKRQSA